MYEAGSSKPTLLMENRVVNEQTEACSTGLLYS